MGFVAINSNETDNHPGDSFEHMVERARERNFPFPYLGTRARTWRGRMGGADAALFLFGRSGEDEDGPWGMRYTGRHADNPRTPGAERTHELVDAGGGGAGGEAAGGGGDEPDRV